MLKYHLLVEWVCKKWSVIKVSDFSVWQQLAYYFMKNYRATNRSIVTGHRAEHRSNLCHFY